MPPWLLQDYPAVFRILELISLYSITKQYCNNFICTTGSKLLISISVTGLSPSAKVTHIILKKPNGVILTKLPVSDTSSGSNRVLYAYYDVTPEV